jgi:hypothetical protein
MELLSVLKQEGRIAWQNIITLDELLFYFDPGHELIWLAPGEMISEREEHIIQSPKMMVTVAWNTSEFHVLAALPKDTKFNTRYYITNILGHIMEQKTASGIKRFRKLIVHVDNARLNTAELSLDCLEANAMKKVPHPAYCSDPTPSDFFLFGEVKRLLKGLLFRSADELLAASESILNDSEKVPVIAVLQEWMRKLRVCAKTTRDYLK